MEDHLKKHKRLPQVVEVRWSISYPAGTYSFKANIMIESNVVIRGEPTTEMAKKGTSPGSLSPKTVFKCTFGEHLGVFNNDP